MTGMFSETVYDRHGLHLQVLVGGIGAPLLVLHDEMGYPGAMGWQRELAESRQLHIPLASGYGIAPRTEWVDSVRDFACVYARCLRDQGLAPLGIKPEKGSRNVCAGPNCRCRRASKISIHARNAGSLPPGSPRSPTAPASNNT